MWTLGEQVAYVSCIACLSLPDAETYEDRGIAPDSDIRSMLPAVAAPSEEVTGRL